MIANRRIPRARPGRSSLPHRPGRGGRWCPACGPFATCGRPIGTIPNAADATHQKSVRSFGSAVVAASTEPEKVRHHRSRPRKVVGVVDPESANPVAPTTDAASSWQALHITAPSRSAASMPWNRGCRQRSMTGLRRGRVSTRSGGKCSLLPSSAVRHGVVSLAHLCSARLLMARPWTPSDVMICDVTAARPTGLRLSARTDQSLRISKRMWESCVSADAHRK